MGNASGRGHGRWKLTVIRYSWRQDRKEKPKNNATHHKLKNIIKASNY